MGVAALADEIEDGLEDPGQHLASDGAVLVTPEVGLHLGMLAEKPRVDERGQVLAALGGELQAFLDQFRAHRPGPLRPV